MKIDNNMTTARIKRILSPKIIAIVFLIVTLVTVVFYVTLENIDKKEVQIWFVTTDGEYSFSDDTLKQINDYGAKHGIDKVVLSRRHPEDIYFDVTMSTSAYYNCDIFIMNEEMAKKYFEMDMFLHLQTDGFEGELLYIDGKPIGLLMNEGYYLLINANADVDLQIIYDIFEMFKR